MAAPPDDYLLRWDATTSAGIGYLTDEATNDIDSWTCQEGSESLGTYTLLDTNVSTNYPEYINDADGLPCVHFQDDGGLWVANMAASNADLWTRLDDATDVTVFVVAKFLDPASESYAYCYQGVNRMRVGTVGLDASVDCYAGGGFRPATNMFDNRRFITSFRNKHNGTNDNDGDAWMGKTNIWSVAGWNDVNFTGINSITFGSYREGGSGWDSDCNIYEVLIYGKALTDAEHSDVVDYLSAKWQATNEDSGDDVISSFGSVDFDPDTLRIVETDTSGDNALTWQEIYSEWKDWLLADASRMRYPQAFRTVGGDPISTTTNLGSTFFLQNRWKFRPAEASHRLVVEGNLFTDPAGESPFVPTLGAYVVAIESVVSNLTEVVEGVGGGGDPAAIADAVWDEAQAEHVGAGSFGLYLDSEVSGAGSGSGGATVADIWNANAASYEDDDTMGGMLNNTVKKPVTGDQPIYEGTWMAIELVDVDQIVTEDDLNTWLGGHVRERLGLTDWTGSSKHARQYALNRSLESLRRRNPPLQFSDLVHPQELSDAIKYGAAEHLYQLAMTGEGDVHDAQRKIWEDKFDKEMNGLMVTVSGGDDIPAGSVSAERR